MSDKFSSVTLWKTVVILQSEYKCPEKLVAISVWPKVNWSRNHGSSVFLATQEGKLDQLQLCIKQMLKWSKSGLAGKLLLYKYSIGVMEILAIVSSQNV